MFFLGRCFSCNPVFLLMKPYFCRVFSCLILLSVLLSLDSWDILCLSQKPVIGAFSISIKLHINLFVSSDKVLQKSVHALKRSGNKLF